MDSMKEAVICKDCDNDMIMSVSTDLTNEGIEAELWTFLVECVSVNQVKMCCAEKIGEGVHNVIQGLRLLGGFHQKDIDVQFRLPPGMTIEEE